MEQNVNRIRLGTCHSCNKPIYADQKNHLLPNNIRYHKNCYPGARRSRPEIIDDLKGELL